jgi:hypothetical protein
MVKVMTIATVVLLVGSVAFAQPDNLINQQQLILISPSHTLGSNLNIFGPDGEASACLNASVSLLQVGSANCYETNASQSLLGTAFQTGMATTDAAGQMQVGQSLDAQTIGVSGFIPSGQNQEMQADGDASQSQGFQVSGAQTTDKNAGGEAEGSGLNIFAFSLGQNVNGSGTCGLNSACIAGSQATCLTGCANADGATSTGVNIIIAQKQTVSQ